MRLLVAAAASGLVLAGCHRWVPRESAPAPGTVVEVILTAEGTAAVTPVIGPRAERLQGSVTGVAGDTLRLGLSEIATRDGQTYFLHGVTLDVPRSYASRLSVRELDRRRTVIAAAIGVAGAGAIISAVRFGGGGGIPGGNGGTPTLRPR